MTPEQVLAEVSARLDAANVLIGRCTLRATLGEAPDPQVLAALLELQRGYRWWLLVYAASCPSSEGPDR